MQKHTWSTEQFHSDGNPGISFRRQLLFFRLRLLRNSWNPPQKTWKSTSCRLGAVKFPHQTMYAFVHKNHFFVEICRILYLEPQIKNSLFGIPNKEFCTFLQKMVFVCKSMHGLVGELNSTQAPRCDFSGFLGWISRVSKQTEPKKKQLPPKITSWRLVAVNFPHQTMHAFAHKNHFFVEMCRILYLGSQTKNSLFGIPNKEFFVWSRK